MLTIIERKTRYLYASRLNTRKSNVVCNEIINIMKPLLPKSITMDRGKEFALFEQIEDELNVVFILVIWVVHINVVLLKMQMDF